MRTHHTTAAIVSTALGLISLAAHAQDDAAAGLFVEARQLPLRSQALELEVRGGEAELRQTLVFANDGPSVGQAELRVPAFEGGAVIGFGFWQGDRFLAAKLEEKGAAEAAHRAAAEAGRPTGLARSEAGVTRFTVHPVPAGEEKAVEIRWRLPVVTELGRSHVRLPSAPFLGGGEAGSSLVARVSADAELEGWGLEGGRGVAVAREARRLHVVGLAPGAVELWWREGGPALARHARRVPIGDGRDALELRLAFQDAASLIELSPVRTVVVLVDASFSMRRRAAAVRALLERVEASTRAELRLAAVGSRVEVVTSPAEVLRAIDESHAGRSASGAALVEAARKLGCGAVGVRCAVVTDPQLGGLERLSEAELPLVVLGDAHELDHYVDVVPRGARVFRVDSDPLAKARSFADALVRPVLRVHRVAAGAATLELVPGGRELPEGGRLSIHGDLDAEAGPELELEVSIDGRPLSLRLEAQSLAASSDEGRRVRRALMAARIEAMTARFLREPSDALRAEIVALSLREEIPSAFTGLRVEDPRLSMYAIKPGDPILSLPSAPDETAALVWYPFGELRRLAEDPDGKRRLDRFLVPRGWRDRGYRVEVFREGAEGAVSASHAWYKLDDRAPEASVRVDPAHGLVVVDTGAETPDIGAVVVSDARGRRALSPVRGQWAVALDELSERFMVEVRDRAGNRARFAGQKTKLGADIAPAPAPRVDRGPSLRAEPRPLWAESATIRVDGREATLRHDAEQLRFSLDGLALRSLDATAVLALGGDRLIFGTRRGDLVRLDCTEAPCRTERLDVGLEEHPIVGLASRPRGRVLVAVLGRGLLELDGTRLVRSRLKVGTPFVTGLIEDRGELLIGTAYRGLWRVVRGRAVRSRFPFDHVARLEAGPEGTILSSGFGRFRRVGRDRFVRLGGAAEHLPVGSAGAMALTRWRGEVYVGGFDRGLSRWDGEALRPVELGLSGAALYVDALAVHGDVLWIGTEDGLFAWDGARATKLMGRPVRALAAGPRGLAVATSEGVWRIDTHGAQHRLDRANDPGQGRFGAVAWLGDEVVAGGLGGLVRFGRLGAEPFGGALGAAWVTALRAHDGALWIGTYAEGLWRAGPDGGARRVAEAGLQWIPPGGLTPVGDAMWVGGLGMAPLVVERGGAVRAIEVPVRDVNQALGVGDRVLLATSDGLVWVGPGPKDERASR